MTDAVKPLPCPFCGGTKVNICDTDFDGSRAYAVSCLTKECHGGVFALGMGEFPTPEEAIEAWNRRTPPAGWRPIEITLTGNQAEAILEAFGGEPTTVTIRHMDSFKDIEDGDNMPAGIYLYYTEYSEEGIIFLGEEDDDYKPFYINRSIAAPENET